MSLSSRLTLSLWHQWLEWPYDQFITRFCQDMDVTIPRPWCCYIWIFTNTGQCFQVQRRQILDDGVTWPFQQPPFPKNRISDISCQEEPNNDNRRTALARCRWWWAHSRRLGRVDILAVLRTWRQNISRFNVLAVDIHLQFIFNEWNNCSSAIIIYSNTSNPDVIPASNLLNIVWRSYV